MSKIHICHEEDTENTWYVNLPPESDDIDWTERDKEEGQLDPGKTNRHVERRRSSRGFPCKV